MIRHKAMSAIQEEHRSLGAVIHGLQYLLRQARDRGTAPDLALLGSMLGYIRDYPEKLHHPAEDRFLFPRIQLRTREADAAIGELEREHAQGEARLERLAAALRRLEDGAPGALEALDEAVRDYAEFHWAHMRKEEEVLLPIAERVLSEEDWGAIHQAFLANQDPRFGGDTADSFRRLFSRIVALAPPPIGVGPPRSG
jgi:hemerythrin-like domain-containing protein